MAMHGFGRETAYPMSQISEERFTTQYSVLLSVSNI